MSDWERRARALLADLGHLCPIAECTLGYWCFLGEGNCKVTDWGDAIEHKPECLWRRVVELLDG